MRLRSTTATFTRRVCVCVRGAESFPGLNVRVPADDARVRTREGVGRATGVSARSLGSEQGSKLCARIEFRERAVPLPTARTLLHASVRTLAHESARVRGRDCSREQDGVQRSRFCLERAHAIWPQAWGRGQAGIGGRLASAPTSASLRPQGTAHCHCAHLCEWRARRPPIPCTPGGSRRRPPATRCRRRPRATRSRRGPGAAPRCALRRRCESACRFPPPASPRLRPGHARACVTGAAHGGGSRYVCGASPRAAARARVGGTRTVDLADELPRAKLRHLILRRARPPCRPERRAGVLPVVLVAAAVHLELHAHAHQQQLPMEKS